jgi:membrane-associated phospholipid phosphatase
VGAVVFASTTLDEDISAKAVEKTSVFGDPQGSSNDLRDIASAAYLLSVIAVPSDTIGDKAAGFAVGLSATLSTLAVADGFKRATGRQRPIDDNDQSFPSGHSAYTSVVTRLTQGNLEYIDMPQWQRTALSAGLYGIAAYGGWARVEAGKHYPSDVMAGYALGSFFAAFFQEAFMSGPRGMRVAFVPADKGGAFTLAIPIH